MRNKEKENAKVNMWDSFTQDITLENCNARLSVLYKERDKISRQISLVTAMGRDTLYYENKYTSISEVIQKLCDFRRTHEGCLLEGDKGYRL